MAKKRKCTIEEIIEANSSEDGVIHYCGKRDRYLIAYNDEVNQRGRVYWTLAHEFGHYLLDHHKESGRSSLSRNEMTDEEYDAFEVEANFFTRFFISPPSLIVEAKIKDYQKVMDFFGISYTAAMNTLKYIENSYKKGFGPSLMLPKKWTRRFKTFLKKVRYGVTCADCGVFSYIKSSKYCVICGSNNFHFFYRGDDIDMVYPSFSLDNDMRVVQCPQCKNEEVEGNYCKICATYLFNICTGFHINDNNDDYYRQGLRWGQHNGGCDQILEGNARFCHECGSTSSFFEDGLLDHWDENQNSNKEVAVTEDPFLDTNNNLDKSDDDLPF